MRLRAVASRWLLNPGPPGVIGAAIGLWIALLPAESLESLRSSLLAAAGVAVLWALVASCYSIARHERDERKRFAREARKWAHEVYTLFSEYFIAEWDANHNRIPDPTVDQELAEKLRSTEIGIREQYFALYSQQISNFLEDLKDAGLLRDPAALSLAGQMTQSNAPEFEDVKRMLHELSEIARELGK